MNGGVPQGLDLQEFMIPYLMNALGRLQPITDNMVFFFAAIALTFTAIRYVASSDESQITTLKWLVPQLMVMAALVWLSTHIADFAYVLHASLTKAGMISGGFDDSTTPLYNPQVMILMVVRVFEIMVQSCRVIDWLNPLTVIGAAFAVICLLISGFVLCLYALVKIYMFKAIVIAGCLMVPPGLWTRTATITEDWITHVVNGGLSMFMLAVCITLPFNFFNELSRTAKISCSAGSFIWIAGTFAVWAVITVSLSQSFSKMVSKAITLYGSK